MLSYSYIAALQRLLHERRSAILTLQLFSHCYTADAHLLLLSSCLATVTFQLFSLSFNIPALYPPSHCSCTTIVAGPCMQSVEPLSQCGWACVLLHTAIHAQSPTQNGRKRSLLSSITFYIARGLMSTDLLCSASPIFSILKYLHVGFQKNWNTL